MYKVSIEKKVQHVQINVVGELLDRFSGRGTFFVWREHCVAHLEECEQNKQMLGLPQKMLQVHLSKTFSYSWTVFFSNLGHILKSQSKNSDQQVYIYIFILFS